MYYWSLKVLSTFLVFSEVTWAVKIVFPKIVTRSKRSNQNNGIELNISDEHSDEFSLYLWKNEHLVTKGTIVEWHYSNGTKTFLRLHEPIQEKVCR